MLHEKDAVEPGRKLRDCGWTETFGILKESITHTKIR